MKWLFYCQPISFFQSDAIFTSRANLRKILYGRFIYLPQKSYIFAARIYT